MVAALIRVGIGAPISLVRDLLAAPSWSSLMGRAPPAPAHGLYLCAVDYPLHVYADISYHEVTRGTGDVDESPRSHHRIAEIASPNRPDRIM